MLYSFCTVITFDYLPYARVLRDSIIEQQAGSVLYIFIAERKENVDNTQLDHKNIKYIFLNDLCENGIGESIFNKYYNENTNSFRWSMKGVLMSFILSQFADKLIYVDCDICFYNDFTFLFEDLNQCNVLLTPHWTVSLPRKDIETYYLPFETGIYNAGFIGANKNALPALNWYANACFDLCIPFGQVCHYSDQSHLNLMPVFFDKIDIVKHRGCNIAGWNTIECKVEKNENGRVLVNNIYPLVFIHYAIYWIEKMAEESALLKSYLDEYMVRLKAYGFDTERIFSFSKTQSQAAPEPENTAPPPKKRRWLRW